MAVNFASDITTALYATHVNTPLAGYTTTFGIPASYIASGSIASIAVNNPGSGYTTVVPTVVIGGDGASGAATARMLLQTAAISNAGSGYAVGNTITLAGGTFTTAAVLTVTSVNTGAVTGFTITTPGVYSAIAASLTQGSTSGSGINFALNTVTWGVQSIVVGTPGTGYTTAPISFTGGTGSGAIATAQLNPAGGAIQANEQNLLMMIEVMRSYFATLDNAQEARLANTILRKMLAEVQQGGGASTYSAANNATRGFNEAMRFFAKHTRNPNL